MDKIKLDVSGHGDLTSQPWEDGWNAIHGLAAAVREGVISDDSRVEGKMRVSVASRSEVAAINERFGDVVEVDESLVQFDEKIIASYFASPTPITTQSFKAVTSLNQKFARTDIKSFNELNQSGVTQLGMYSDWLGDFACCKNLRSVNLENIIKADTGVFFQSGVEILFLPKCTDLGYSYNYYNGGFAAQCPNLKGVFVPRIKNFGNNYIGANHFEESNNIGVLDLGASATHINADAGNANANLVIRASIVLDHANQSVNGIPAAKKIFVPSSVVDTYKASDWSSVSSKIYAISGPEWKAEFGSEDEYADIDKYVTDQIEREKIKQAYRDA